MIRLVANGKAPAASSPKMVEVAPHRFVQLEMNFKPAEIVLCDVVEQADGSFKLVPRTFESLVRVSNELSQKLGLGKTTDTLRRLIRGGFVDGARTAPGVYTVNLASYFAHFKKCAENPDYWANPKVLAVYRETI
jgi:hypothetical protein